MDLLKTIQKFAGYPISHQVLLSSLKDYKKPNDKIRQLKQDGIITPLRKGLYVVTSDKNQHVSPILMANQIYGPSYVSLDYALQHYGAIPERVYRITSVSSKPTKEFENTIGTFSYTHISLAYYRIGINNISLGDKAFGLIASPEKALIDKLVTTPGINLRSKKEVNELLLEDWRISENWLQQLKTEQIENWLGIAPKSSSIEHLIKFLSA